MEDIVQGNDPQVTQEPQVQEPAQPAVDAGGDQTANQDGNLWDFALDADGNPVFSESFLSDGDDGAQSEPTPEGDESPKEGEDPKDQQTEPEPLDMNRMVTVKVDGQDVQVPLQEALNGYMRQAAFTKKTQELAQQRQQLQAMQVNTPQPQVQQPIQPKPEDVAAQQKRYIEQMDAYAKERVKALYGADFDEYNPQHMAAYVNEVGNVKAAMIQRVNEERAAQEAENARQQRMSALTAKYQQDPNFDAINSLAQKNLENLPYKMYKQVTDAMATGNVEVIDNYMSAVRDMFYGNTPKPTVAQPQSAPQQAAAQQSVQPPFVEQTNNRAQQPVVQTPDWSKLGRMTNDQQAAMISKYAKDFGV